MYPSQFEYAAPATLDEAIALLAEHGEGAAVLSGGQSLIPAMKIGLAYPEFLVDLGHIPGLQGIDEVNGHLRIGGMTTHARCERSDLLKARYPTLGQATEVIADPIVRNRGTVGGSLAHADPSGDLGSVMLALGATFVARGADGEREIPATAFFSGPFMTALAPGEILTGVRIPKAPAHSGGAYLKLERKVGDFATAAVAVHLVLDGETITDAGIGLTAVGPTNLKATEAEEALRGSAATDDAFREAGRLAAQACQPRDDLRGSAAYKRAVIEAFTVRGLREAAAQARA